MRRTTSAPIGKITACNGEPGTGSVWHVTTKVLVVDNYDSFVYNLVQYLGQLGADPVVRRNDELTLSDVEELAPSGIVISPGPGQPEDAGMSVPLIKALAGQVPILGVCLGHQAIGVAFGAKVVRAAQLLHGKTSQVSHDGRGIFEELPQPLTATRYHSLVVERATFSDDLEVSAWAEDGTVMGVRHKALAVDGVQFHPEAVLTEGGHRLMANWLRSCGFGQALVDLPAGPLVAGAASASSV
jgi:anthranilate synthase/aminodeoxychorismate synthase-like glutamine amidotransferase